MKTNLNNGKESIIFAEKNLGWPRAPRVFTSGEKKMAASHDGSAAKNFLRRFVEVFWVCALFSACGLIGLAFAAMFLLALLSGN